MVKWLKEIVFYGGSTLKERMRKLAIVLLAPMMFISMIGITPASANDDKIGIRVDAAILVDADTGKILYEENADAPLGIASMTKMMAEYLLFEAIEEGKLKWDDEYIVNNRVHQISQDRLLSNVPLRENEPYTMRELYEAVAIYSANAATVGIAEKIAGTEAEFLKLMNKKAEELGLEDYKFVNSTGLNNSHLKGMHIEGTGEDDENVMPARSVARLAYNLLHDYPEVLETSKINTKMFREGTDDEIKMDNWNFMLPGFVYEYEGVDGLKTGTTEFAGQTFTGTAVRDGKRLIAVVMNAVDKDGESTYEARFSATRALFDYGFGQFSDEELVPSNYTFEEQETIEVTKGKDSQVGIAVKDPISMVIKTREKDAYTPQLVLDESLLEDGMLQAPVEKGTVVGHVKMIHEEDKDYGYLYDQQHAGEVVVTEDVKKAGWFKLSMRATGAFFVNVWDGATGFIKGLFS